MFNKEVIVIIAVVLILVLAIFYVVKMKKKGVKCIGCPQAGNCSSKNDAQNKCNETQKK